MQTNLKSPSNKNVRMPNKPRTISERLAEAAKNSFVGRKAERALISDAIAAAELPFMVAFIHGPGGIGKSRLIRAALSNAGPEVRRYILDCREIEPTPQGFQIALGALLEVQEPEPDLIKVVNCLSEQNQRSVLALDTYETFGLMDTWLRQEFLPSLTENVFTVIAGREAPNPAWLTSPGWSALFKEIKLGELSREDTLKMLETRGLRPDQIERVRKFAKGFPLALELAAAAISTKPDLEIAAGPPPKILQQLTDAFLAGLRPEIIEAVEAASTVRRITEPLLGKLLSKSDVREIYNNLQTLPFIEATADGQVFQDVVRETISRELERRDPERYRKLRRRAYSYFTKQSHRAVANTLWQYTADLLYMIENPIARGAFFPEGASDLTVEPATANSTDEIHQIIDSNEPDELGFWLKRWWDRHPETFNIARSPNGRVEAFYFTFEPEKVGQTLINEDPFTSNWLRHLDQNPLEPGERVLLLPRWLDRATGEKPSAAVGACFLDIKRTYMELRPGLRRIYTAVKDWNTFVPVLSPLGFAPLKKINVTISGITYQTLMNDFGPSSIDGWLARLIGTELGVESADTRQKKPSNGTAIADGRRLITVLFTDIVGSTEKAVEYGDTKWRNLLDHHHALVRKALSKFKGREIDTAGDGFFATFEQPANAIRCASAVSKQVAELDLEIRAGLHLGECEFTDGAVRGVTVHIGARVAAKAKAGDVLVSRTVKEALAGSEIRFKERGAYQLKGIPGEWSLFAAEL
jgi:class 3 adenylate cyclase